MNEPVKWVRNVLLGLDQLGNAVIGGSPDETISSRSHQGGLWRILEWFLALFEKDHSLRSVEFTPWGTPDPHHLSTRSDILADWRALELVVKSPEAEFPEEVMASANRAQQRLSHWLKERRVAWGLRMAADLREGERLQ